MKILTFFCFAFAVFTSYMSAATLDLLEFDKNVSSAISKGDTKTLGVLVMPIIATQNPTECRKAAISLLGRMDANFNPSKSPEINIKPPPGGFESAGTDPAGIADPKRRADYQKSIVKAREYAEYYKIQSAICENATPLIERVEIMQSKANVSSLDNKRLDDAIKSFLLQQAGSLNSVPVLEKVLATWKTIHRP